MAKEIILSYSQARELAASFSILNCKAKRWPFRWIGHTAMIYRDEETGSVWVYESTLDDHANGVRLKLFSDWLRDYPGQVWLRRCVIGDGKLKRRSKAALRHHIKLHRGTPYPDLKKRAGRWYLIKAKWDSWIFRKASTNKDTSAWFFCTHLVANVFRWASLVVEEKMVVGSAVFYYAPSEFAPDDMRDGSFDDWLWTGVKLEPEVRIK